MGESVGLRRRKKGIGGEEMQVFNGEEGGEKTQAAKAAVDEKAMKASSTKSGGGRFVHTRMGWEKYVEVVLFLIGFAARFYKLGDPKAVVFDEFHFGKFINWTFQRKYYFDIHPPLGKLVLAAWGYFTGYEPVEGFMYDKIGVDMGTTLFYPLREFSAFIGSFVPVIAYRTGRLMGFDPAAAIIPGICVALDNLLVIESRLILVDSQRWLWLAITGTVAGAAFGIKWTALAYPGIIAIISFFGLYFLEKPLTILECMFAGFCGIVAYTVPFYIHFKLLINSGSGDNFMETGFRHLLLGNQGYDPTLKPPSFLYNFIYLNRRMFISNKGISNKHHWSSVWYQWIVNWRGVLYFRKIAESEEGKPYRVVYLFSNPAVTWLSGVAVLIYLLALFVLARYRDTEFLKRRQKAWTEYAYIGSFLICSWLANLLPYILVDRSSFAYHYLPGLYFAELCLGMTVQFFPRRLRWPVLLLLASIIIAAYIYWAPWVYAIMMPVTAHNKRKWLRRWD